MNPFKNMNVFSLLLVLATFAIVLRVIDIASVPRTLSTPASIAESKEPAASFKEVDHGKDVPAPADIKPMEEKPEEKKAETEAAPPPPPEPSYGETAYSASEIEVLQSLSKRRESLEKRDQKISQREALLAAAEKEVDKKIAELDQLRNELKKLLDQQQASQDAQINSLVKIYEGMKPKEAARIFDTLEMEVLLPMIGKMAERKSSPILAAMNPDKAREVTIKLSEQRKLPAEKKQQKADTAPPTKTNPPALPPE